MGDELNQYMSDIIAEKGLSGVDEAVRAQLIADMKERYSAMLDRALIEALPEDKIEGLNALLDSEVSDGDVQQYIVSAGVDTRQVVAQTLLRFRELYLR